MASEYTPNSFDKREQLGRLLANAILSEDHGREVAELALQQKLTLLSELKGHVLHLTAPAKDHENTETKLIESYVREENGEPTNWLPPDDYIVGELDTTDPTNPMMFVHQVNEPEHLRYFVYVNDLRLIEDEQLQT